MTTMTHRAQGITHRPTDRRGWLAADLPPVIHEMTSRFGERLDARFIGAYDRFGIDGVLSEHETPKLEVRHANRLDAAFGYPGRTIALIDTDNLDMTSAACWALLHEAMPYAIDPDTWRSLLAALDKAVADRFS